MKYTDSALGTNSWKFIEICLLLIILVSILFHNLSWLRLLIISWFIESASLSGCNLSITSEDVLAWGLCTGNSSVTTSGVLVGAGVVCVISLLSWVSRISSTAGVVSIILSSSTSNKSAVSSNKFVILGLVFKGDNTLGVLELEYLYLILIDLF